MRGSFAKKAIFFAVSAACLLSKADVDPWDDYLCVEPNGERKDLRLNKRVDTSEGAYFWVTSESPLASVTVTGLPAGVKYDKNKGIFYGAPSKAGVYYVECKAKNKSGFTHSAIQIWNVGNASNGDYDNINLSERFDPDVLDNLATGYEMEEICTNLKQVSGLPPGLKFISSKCDSSGMCTACGGFINGIPTKAGKYKLTFADYSSNKAVKTIIVQDSGCRWLNVVSTDVSRGTVSGSKVYAVGAKASLSAKPAKGYYFAGWYLDEECTEPLSGTASGDWRKSSDSVTVTHDIADSGIYAKFVSAGEDYIDIMFASLDGDVWYVDTSWSDYMFLDVYSETLPAVTVKGLPAGIKYDKKEMVFSSDPSKLKPGASDVEISVKTATGETAGRTLRIFVPNIESDVLDGLDYSEDAYETTIGVSDACLDGDLVYFSFPDGWNVTASGLPPGMKLTVSSGCCGMSASGSIGGIATKPGVYTATLTGKKGSQTTKATITIRVNPIPEYAVGTFNGLLVDDEGNVQGTVSMTATDKGKLTAKVVCGAKTYTYSANSWECMDEDSMSAYFEKSSSKEYSSLSITVRGGEWNSTSQAEGEFTQYFSTGCCGLGDYEDYTIGAFQKNPLGKPAVAEAQEKIDGIAGTYQCDIEGWDNGCDIIGVYCPECYVGGSSYKPPFKVTVDKKGVAKLSGIHPDYGAAVSASSQVMFDGESVYALFYPQVKVNVCGETDSGKMVCYKEQMAVPVKIYFW